MSRLIGVLAVAAALLLTPPASAQPEPPKPGPEHEKLRNLEGTWEATISMMGSESKGTVTYKMELGGFWLVGEFKADFGGMAFTGRSLDSYDPVKKKYVGYWFDSWSTRAMTMEGEMDKDGKKLVMTGEGPGEGGKIQKYRTVTEYKDKDTIHWTMFGPGPDGKEAEMIQITYKRKK